MFRRLILALAAGGVMLAQTGASPGGPNQPRPFDKPALESYIRHLFVWGTGIDVTVSDPEKAPMPGFVKVKVRGSAGNQVQEEVFYVSDDGQSVLRGVVYNMAQNPFKGDLDKIVTANQPGMGTSGAPVVIAQFSDFQCPYCREEAKVLRASLLATYPKEVRLYFLDYPLASIHPWAKAVAIAGRCIFHQNAAAFWDYHDWIFETQPKLTAETLKSSILEFIGGKGVDAGQFSTCYDGRLTEAEVEKTLAQGRALEVNSTPTMFVNGRRMVGSVSWNNLKMVIDDEIAYQKTAKNAGEDCNNCSVTVPIPGAPGTATPVKPRK